MADNNKEKKGVRPPNSMMLSRTLVLMIVCGVAAFIVLGARLFQLQILDHELYESEAIAQQVRSTTLSSSRGTIYDSNMKILAMSATVETIYISPAEIIMYDEDPSLIARGLSEILGVDYYKIMEYTEDEKSWYKAVAHKVDEETANKVREFKNENNLYGVKIENDTKRYYPYGDLACHVVGFVGFENTGLSGIEASLDGVLTGVAGRVIRAKNAFGTDMMFTKFEDYYDSEDGYSIKLTLDSTIQYYMEKHLEQAIEDYDVQNGAAAIAMNPKTGAIYGMVSLNDFDLNNYQEVSDEVYLKMQETADEAVRNSILDQAQREQWRNKALIESYEPGSTFKILTLTMAVEENLAGVDDPFYCGGSIDVVGREPDNPVNCWKTAGHGAQNLIQAVQHSCNVAFVELGLEIGAEKFYDYVEAFGLFDETGIELSGEGGSLWWPEENFTASYDKSSLAAASFGQTFNVTPIQLITSISACINGGYLMQPYVVEQIIDEDGGIVSQTVPEVKRQVVSEETSEIVRSVLQQVVSDSVEGTGKNAYVAGYTIGGKTGTSTDTVFEAATGIKEYIVSFVGFAPAEDPEICILVLLDNPSNESGIYVSGGNMAAPTVGNMMADILPYLGVEAVYTDEELRNMDKTVPNTIGMTITDAQEAAAMQGLGYRVIGTGTNVTAQLPAANSVVAAGSDIILYADSEPSPELEEMPDLAGLTYDIARQRLGYYGLFIKTNSNRMANSDTIVVSKQSIEPGELVEHGTVIEVTLIDTDTSAYGRY